MSVKVKEKEEILKFKELRRELEEKMSEYLPEAKNEEIHVHVERLDEALAIDETTAKRIVEALLFSTPKPMTVNEIKKVLKGYTASQIQKIVDSLREEYTRDDRSFRLIEIAGGFEIATESKYAPWIMKLELQKKARQATAAALETLAILAYKQPVTRAEIESIRGVNSAGTLVTLLERGFIKIVGRKEVPGRPILYGTSEKFLEHFGLRSVKDLPDISEIKQLVENAIRREELLVPKETVIKKEEEDFDNIPATDESAEETLARLEENSEPVETAS